MYTHSFLYKHSIAIPVLLFFLSFETVSQVTLDTTATWKPYYGINGADTATSHAIGNCTFFVYNDYVIVERQLVGGEIGSDIFVTTRKGKNFPEVNCEKTAKKCAMKVLNKWAEYFLAKRGSFIILRSENGLEKKLIIYNIQIRQKIFESDFSEPAYFNTAGELCFWMETGTANPDNCPEYTKLKNSGYTPVIEREVTFNMQTQNLFYSTDIRCNHKK